MTERLPYVAGSETSEAAAVTLRPTARTLRAKVYRFIRDQAGHGATDEEAQLFLGMNPSTERPRRRELQQQGLIRDSGLTRRTRSNRQAVVWVAVDGPALETPGPTRNERKAAFVQAGRAYALAFHQGRPRDERAALAKALVKAAREAYPTG